MDGFQAVYPKTLTKKTDDQASDKLLMGALKRLEIQAAHLMFPYIY